MHKSPRWLCLIACALIACVIIPRSTLAVQGADNPATATPAASSKLVAHLATEPIFDPQATNVADSPEYASAKSLADSMFAKQGSAQTEHYEDLVPPTPSPLPEIPASAYNDLRMVPVTYHATGNEVDIAWEFPYGDSLFLQSPNTYSHKLAQASLGLAVSAFRKINAPLNEKDRHVRTFFENTGFQDIRTYDYDIAPAIDTIGTAIAHKRIDADAQSFELIALGISGAGYLDEWMSNFAIGDSYMHLGFTQAAMLVLSRVSEYIAEFALTGPVKIWISGYSRAAAVSNIAAAMFGSDISDVRPEAVYAYTFGTPNTTKLAYEYPNIFNIVGQFDPVASVPFEQWDYHRFGSTFYLPAREVNADFEARSERVKQVYSKMTGQDFWINPEANWLVHKLCEFLCDFVRTSADYEAHYQQIFINVWKANGSLLDRIVIAAKQIRASSAVMAELDSEKSAFWTLLSEESYQLLLEKIGWTSYDWNGAASLSSNILHEHFPQKYVAWMSSYESAAETFSLNCTYKRIAITGPVDIEVTDVYDNPIGEVRSNQIVPISGSSMSIMHIGNEFLITFPSDQDYIITFTGTGEGELQYAIREHQSGYTSSRVLKFDAVPIESGKQFISVVEREQQRDRWDSLLVEADSHNVVLPDFDSLTDGEDGAGAASDLMLAGSVAEGFLDYVGIGLGVVLALVLAGVWLGVHRYRKHRRAAANPIATTPKPREE